MPVDQSSHSPSSTVDFHPGIKKPPTNVPIQLDPLLDSEEAAALLKIHPKTLQKLARKGLVHGIHVGKLWRFRTAEIERWINSQMVG